MSFPGHVNVLRLLFQAKVKKFRFLDIHNIPRQYTAASEMQRYDFDSAYQYICHIEEAKRWMESILQEQLPPALEFEENIRNGVYLAKLAHFISPETVPLSRIYDPDQRRYKAVGLQFKHTDNINHWLQVFHPLTTDVYDKKNMPRVLYSLHALAAHLHLLGRTEKMEVLNHKVIFSDEDVAKVRVGLKQRGLKVPTFYNIESILEAEARKTSSVAVTGIVNALLEKDTLKLLFALKNPVLGLHGVDNNLAHEYLSKLQDASKLKEECTCDQLTEEIVSAETLSLVDIQDAIRFVNVMEVWKKVELAVENNNEDELLEALQAKSLELKAVNPKNVPLYKSQLSQITRNSSLKVTSVLECKILLQKVINTGAYSGFKTHQEWVNIKPGSPRAA